MRFDTYYAAVPEAQRDALREFRTAHSPKQTLVNGTTWHYLTAGNPENPPLLWLVGGLRRADAAYRSIPLLADAFYIIAPDYPPVHSMSDMGAGLAAVMDAEQVTQAHVLAGSFGGMVAQVFVREHGDRVKRLILSTTTAPNPDAADNYATVRDFVQNMDTAVALESAKTQFFEIIAPPENEATFYRAYLDELFSERVTHPELLSTYDCILDYMRNHSFKPGDLTHKGDHILIIASTDDATFNNDAQNNLVALYPEAQTHIFSNAGHSPASTQREAYFQRVRAFLTEA